LQNMENACFVSAKLCRLFRFKVLGSRMKVASKASSPPRSCGVFFMSIRSVMQTSVFITALLLISSEPASLAKSLRLPTEKVVINASPECVFEALRIERDALVCHRKTLSFDGKVAKIDECMQNIPIFGQVHCVWEETEFPYKKMDYRMLQSDHFKSASGSWVIVPTSDSNKTTLELRSTLDSGLTFPFSEHITKVNASKDAKERLSRIKDIAEKQAAGPKTIISSSTQSK
jgi:hypothetical protein